jgi:hypothetical protein
MHLNIFEWKSCHLPILENQPLWDYHYTSQKNYARQISSKKTAATFYLLSSTYRHATSGLNSDRKQYQRI